MITEQVLKLFENRTIKELKTLYLSKQKQRQDLKTDLDILGLVLEDRENKPLCLIEYDPKELE